MADGRVSFSGPMGGYGWPSPLLSQTRQCHRETLFADNDDYDRARAWSDLTR